MKEWLPLLWTGPEARRKNGHIFHGSAKPGIVFFGPYWRLPEGSYEAVFKLEAETRRVDAGEALIFAAMSEALAAGVGSAIEAQFAEYRSAPYDGRYPLCTFQAISHEYRARLEDLVRRQLAL